MNVIFLLTGYIAIVNLIGFLLMGIDKRKAVKHAFRIPEATLFTIALIGGSIGSIAGMYFFRHKTKHAKFRMLVPLFLVLHIALGVYILKSGLLP